MTKGASLTTWAVGVLAVATLVVGVVALAIGNTGTGSIDLLICLFLSALTVSRVRRLLREEKRA